MKTLYEENDEIVCKDFGDFYESAISYANDAWCGDGLVDFLPYYEEDKTFKYNLKKYFKMDKEDLNKPLSEKKMTYENTCKWEKEQIEMNKK